jgi:hypothetical protein
MKVITVERSRGAGIDQYGHDDWVIDRLLIANTGNSFF